MDLDRRPQTVGLDATPDTLRLQTLVDGTDRLKQETSRTVRSDCTKTKINFLNLSNGSENINECLRTQVLK